MVAFLFEKATLFLMVIVIVFAMVKFFQSEAQRHFWNAMDELERSHGRLIDKRKDLRKEISSLCSSIGEYTRGEIDLSEVWVRYQQCLRHGEQFPMLKVALDRFEEWYVITLNNKWAGRG